MDATLNVARFSAFVKNDRMSQQSDAADAPRAKSWNEDRIFMILADPTKRKLLHLLAKNGPKAASELCDLVARSQDATFKHLVGMHSAHLVTMEPDRRDRRRQVYSLSPRLPIKKTDTGLVLDFGFVSMPLGSTSPAQ